MSRGGGTYDINTVNNGGREIDTGCQRSENEAVGPATAINASGGNWPAWGVLLAVIVLTRTLVNLIPMENVGTNRRLIRTLTF